MNTQPNMNQQKYLHLDKNAFEKYFSGIEPKRSVKLYVKTANLFLETIEARLSGLATALKEYNNQNAILIAHQIKGSLLSLGGTVLADAFRRIEMSVNLAPNEELSTLLEGKRTDINQFIAELREWMAYLESTQGEIH